MIGWAVFSNLATPFFEIQIPLRALYDRPRSIGLIFCQVKNAPSLLEAIQLMMDASMIGHQVPHGPARGCSADADASNMEQDRRKVGYQSRAARDQLLFTVRDLSNMDLQKKRRV